MKALWLASLLLATTALADKPAAVQVCVDLPSGVALYSSDPHRDYRALPDGGYVLDLELFFNGAPVERIAKSSPRCLRATVQAQPIREIAVRFDRTDLNLKPQKRAVSLQCKPDLWYDGGSFTVEKAAFSRISPPLEGKLELARVEDTEWSKGRVPVKDLTKLPAGRYAIKFDPPPPPLGSCEIDLRVKAVGTVTEESRPEQLKALVDAYGKDIAPEIAKRLKAGCSQAQVLEIELRIFDGTYQRPWSPKVVKVTRVDREKKYELVQDGIRMTFVNGILLDVGYGQTVSLEPVEAEKLALQP